MGAEGFPAVKAEEGSFSGVIDKVMLQTDGNLERCVAFGADLVLSDICRHVVRLIIFFYCRPSR